MPTSSKSLCLPETRRHFWVSATRLYFAETFPRKISLNWFMPALVNMSVGSFFITIGAEGTISCPLEAKKSRNVLEIFFVIILKKKVLVALFNFFKKFILALLAAKFNFN